MHQKLELKIWEGIVCLACPKNTNCYAAVLQTPRNTATVLRPLEEFTKNIRTIIVLCLGYLPRGRYAIFAHTCGAPYTKNKNQLCCPTWSDL